MTERLEPFSVTDALPTGTTLLEASAGTGKTWTIAALVTRFVAEGEALLEQMLVVTFGRAASQELRERVREQLVEAERALAGDPALPDVPPSDLIALLLHGDADEIVRRHQRVRDALTAFDAATIATTHQFCSMVLDSLGVAGDTDSNAHLVEDLDDLLVEVVDDLYLRGFALADEPAFTYRQALAIARRAVNDPQARLEPTDEEPGTTAHRRLAFAEAVRTELDRRKRRLGILSYDDLLSQLAKALEEADAPARVRMRQRWKIVLVDEFQDTDPVQWEVLDRAFSGHATMVLIGDPKQAIYAFRGGDVTTYLRAAASATTRKTLAVNWRSDAALVDALGSFLGGAALGDDRIVVHDVGAHHQQTRLVGAPKDAPFRLRVVRRADVGGGGSPKVGDVRPHIATDLAVDILRLLTSGAKFGDRPLEARDVAVIAHTHDTLAEVQRALQEVGIPAVIAGAGSVFATAAATEWLTLLEALEQPHRSARVRAAGLTSFFGYSTATLDEGGPDLTDTIADRLRSWAELFALRGVAAVLEAATAGGMPARVLEREGGERLLTDLEHIGEALHGIGLRERLGLVSMLVWLRRQVAEGTTDRTGERTRRLDSDAAAVQLVTIHASKGLQYPVVYLPGLWDRFPRDPDMPLFHDAEGTRCVAVGRGGRRGAEFVERAMAEELGESLRLLYVAMTRARSQIVCWWAPTAKNTATSSLHRLLARPEGEADVPGHHTVWSDKQLVEVFAGWKARGGPSPEAATWGPVGLSAPESDVGNLSVRTFTRTVDAAWRRTSYSSLTAVEVAVPAAGGVGSEPEVVAKDDEEVGPAVTAGVDPTATSTDPVSPMAGLPVGATFGSLVHAVLEHADPDAADLRAELRGHIDDQLVRWPVDLDRDQLAEALVAVCDTPLGPLAPTTLRQIPLRDRLRELDFELPLSGGDLIRDAAGACLGDLAPLLRRHLPESDPVRAYARALDQPVLGAQSLRGYLTGSVDVVLRLPGPRYVVVDYKTNWLGGHDQPLTAAAYRPEALAAAMGHSDYPLQALLYAVVLHRFLRWRQPGYDPDLHLGGVLYLYLRGMCGPETPVVDGHPCGVFAWRPPATLLDDLSDLLDGLVPR